MLQIPYVRSGRTAQWSSVQGGASFLDASDASCFKASLPQKASIHVEISFGKPNCIKSISIIFLRTFLSEVIVQHIVLFLGCDAWEKDETVLRKLEKAVFSFYEKTYKTHTYIQVDIMSALLLPFQNTFTLCKYLR